MMEVLNLGDYCYTPSPHGTMHVPRSRPQGQKWSLDITEAVNLRRREHRGAVDFFNQVNLLYGTLTEFCKASTCPTMSAGSKYEYRWADGITIKKPIEVSAPKYVEYLMDWIEAQLDDESIFPQKLDAPFPPNFQDVVKTISKRLFRVYAHIYHSHFQKIVSLKEEAHLNTCFKHFVLFMWEFRLIDKGELAPLYELVESILQC
ncbi:MOB kinase activator-like 1A [Abeliophyllum distichum]|uniref:MOB kinase activator-like 1A n=1 Tax=Abeliophyllum distichum TaxID=126358 RepID=A0ABD1VAK9_9LAMI